MLMAMDTGQLQRCLWKMIECPLLIDQKRAQWILDESAASFYWHQNIV